MALSQLPEVETSSLAITVRSNRRDPHEVAIVLRGEIDLSTVPAVRSVIEGLEVEQRTVVLDLERVTFIDSMGVGLLVDLRRRFEPDFRELVLRAPSERVRQVLDITGLLEVFPISE